MPGAASISSEHALEVPREGDARTEVAEQRTELRGGLWFAVQISLDFSATLVAKLEKLLLGLDAFGCRGDPERAAEPDDGTDDGNRVRLVIEVANERLVDLDLVEGKLSQVAEARIPGAEIVHRDAHAEFPQLMER